MNEVEVLEKPTINTKKLRARKIVTGITEGKTYQEIANEVMPGVKYPRQTVYNSIQSDYVQAEIGMKLAGEIESWNEEKIAQKIAYLAENAKNDSNKLKALELLAKWKAMLTEKRENTNRQTFETSKELKGIETKDLILELEARLKLSSQGVNTSENVKKA